jgi:mono/diheme cytochrome c family protein
MGLQKSVAAVAAALVLAACDAGSTSGEDPRANPGDLAKVALGAKLYLQHCAACHGVKLEGQPDWRKRLPNGRLPAPPHDDGGHTWHHPDAVLFGITKFGLVPRYAPQGYQTDMPAFGEQLSDDEIWAVLAYIGSHWTAAVLPARAEMIRNTKQR